MDAPSLIAVLFVGGIAGWLAGKFMRGGGFGIFANIVVGIIGAIIGGFVFGLFGIRADGLIGAIIMATIGAGILLYVVGLFKKID